MTTFSRLNADDLRQLIHSKEFDKLPFLPITRHRALSQLANPRARAEDVLLILAWCGNSLAGYAGILPDYFEPTRGKRIRFGWLTGLYVDQEARGQGLGEELIRKALDAWDNKIIAADYVFPTEKLYLRAGAFQKPIINEGIRIYFRFDMHALLPPRHHFFSHIKPLLQLVDLILNIPVDLVRSMAKRKMPPLRYDEVKEVNGETGDFIRMFDQPYGCNRGAGDINWITAYPWILAVSAEKSTGRYHFSDVDRYFAYRIIRAFADNDLPVAVLMFSQRNGLLKIPYAYFEPVNLDKVCRLICFLCAQWKINTLAIFHPLLTNHFSTQEKAGFLIRKTKRRYMISDEILKTAGEYSLRFQDGDGDVAFT